MKSLKFFGPLLILALIISFIPACKASETEVAEEAVTEEKVATTAQETTDEPTVEETVAEEPEEVIQGEPELVWSINFDNELASLAVSPQGETVTVGEYLTTYTVHLYDGSIIDVNTYEHTVEDIDFSPDGSVIGAGLTVYGAFLTNVIDSTDSVKLHDGYNTRLAFSPGGEHIATGNRDGIVWIWRTDNGELITSLEASEAEWIQAIDFHPSGKLLAVTHFDCTVNIWDTEEEEIVNTIQLDSGEGSCGLSANTFRFSPDGTVMAGAIKEDGAQIIRLWTVEGFQQLKDLSIPKRVRDLAFSADGKLLAVGSRLATTVWDVQAGELLYTFDQEFDVLASNSPVALSFTIDGGYVVEARNDETLELWRLPGAEPIDEPVIDMKEPPPLPGDVLFDTGKSELKTDADPVLEEFASDLYAALPEASITFIGHTDSRGDSDSNMKLSLERATAVKDWFEKWVQDNRADGWELFVEGRGDSQLKVPDVDVEENFLEEAGKLNRRVEIEIETAY